MSEWAILGCGYVGTRLARRLLAEGHSVRAFSRHPEKLATLHELGARVHGIDASKSRQFGPALYGARSPVVVYSIPSLGNMPAGEPVRRAAEASASVGATRFIYLSSTAVYGPTPEGEVVDEDTALALFDPDAAPRVADEGAVEGARLAGLSTVVLRLAAVYGPGRGVRERVKAGTYKLIDEGEHMFSRVHVDDVVGIIMAAAERAPNPGLYCVADDRPTTQKEYADWLVARLGAEPLPRVPSLAPGRPRRPVRNRAVSNGRLKRELGYAFRFPSYLEGELAIEAELGGQPVAPPPAVEAVVQAPAVEPPAAPPPVAESHTPSVEVPDMALQKPASLVEVIGQVEELWMKAMADELGEMVRLSDADRLADAREALRRAAAVAELLEHQRRTLSPYLEIRKGISLDQIAPEVWAAFERALSRHGVELPKLNTQLVALAKALLDFDAAMLRFRREPLLRIANEGAYFPALWDVDLKP